MNNKILHIILISFLMIAVFACHKDTPNITDMPITMSITEAGSAKALLNATTFETTGNRIKIYDNYSGGSIQEGYYIDDVIKCATPGYWPFEGENYEWTTNGVHKFFGWMLDDVSVTEPFTPSFNEDTQILTIPTTTLGQNTVQYDFMYSDIHTRAPETEGFGPVPLVFSHLFTAFNLTASNNSSNKIILKGVTISGLKDTRKVTIHYGGDVPVLEYSEVSSTSKFAFNKTVGGVGTELTSTQEPITDGYYIMWPHTKNDFNGDGVLPAAIITVVYDYIELDDKGNPTTNTVSTVEKNVLLQDMTWDPGKKYDLNLQFKDKEIILNCLVADWIPEEEEIDFTETVYGSMPLTWVEGTVAKDDKENGEVFLINDVNKIAECKFKIDTPKSASWTASLITIDGQQDAFSIVDDTKYGPVGIECTIKIKINNPDPIAPLHICLLRITVQTTDGRTIVVNNMMPNETNPNITEYKIIQNPING